MVVSNSNTLIYRRNGIGVDKGVEVDIENGIDEGIEIDEVKWRKEEKIIKIFYKKLYENLYGYTYHINPLPPKLRTESPIP